MFSDIFILIFSMKFKMKEKFYIHMSWIWSIHWRPWDAFLHHVFHCSGKTYVSFPRGTSPPSV